MGKPWNFESRSIPQNMFLFPCFFHNPLHKSDITWLVVWNIFYVPYIGKNNPNWLSYFFQRGRAQPPTRNYIYTHWWLLGHSAHFSKHLCFYHWSTPRPRQMWCRNVILWPGPGSWWEWNTKASSGEFDCFLWKLDHLYIRFFHYIYIYGIILPIDFHIFQDC